MTNVSPMVEVELTSIEKLQEHRSALVTIFKESAELNRKIADLKGEYQDLYETIDLATTAKHMAGIAKEAFNAGTKDYRSFNMFFREQMSLISADIFSDYDNSTKLRKHLGDYAKRFRITLFFCQEVVEPWSKGLYGLQPSAIETLGKAYEIARRVHAVKNMENERWFKDAVRESWKGIYKKFNGNKEAIQAFLEHSTTELNKMYNSEPIEKIA